MTDPKGVVESHVQAFGAKDAEAEPWTVDETCGHQERW